MLKAKDIMTKDIISVKRNTSVYEAASLLVQHNISGMPVVEDDMTLVGIISEKDTILLFYDDPTESQKKTVNDFMTQPAIYFDEDESLLDVADFLVKNIFRRVPITSKGKIVGIVSIKDVLQVVLDSSRQSVKTA